MIFKEYSIKGKKNRLTSVGDVSSSRENFYQKKPNNLFFLLKNRYEWMNDHIESNDTVLEVGCGMGLSKEFLRDDIKLILSDIEKHPWTTQAVDALDTKFPNNSLDVVFCSNMIHHLAYPTTFFQEMSRILKPGGKLLIQEINCSILCKIMLRLLQHEGWSFNKNPFSLTEPCNDPEDPWSGNNALPNLLFDNANNFELNNPHWKINERRFSECFIFPLSGGVTAKAKTINLPFWLIEIIKKIDDTLIFIAPNIFALQRKIVLEKI